MPPTTTTTELNTSSVAASSVIEADEMLEAMDDSNVIMSTTPKTTPKPSMNPMNSTKSIHSILKEVNSKLKKEEKMKVLEDNDSKTLRFILQAAYDKNVSSLLPEGEPPYNPVEKKKQLTLHAFVGDIPKLFKNGPMQGQPLTKVEMFFMNLLAALEPEEAKVLVLAKDQRLNSVYKRITKPLVKEFLDSTVKIV